MDRIVFNIRVNVPSNYLVLLKGYSYYVELRCQFVRYEGEIPIIYTEVINIALTDIKNINWKEFQPSLDSLVIEHFNSAIRPNL